jgi:hypothetical protein
MRTSTVFAACLVLAALAGCGKDDYLDGVMCAAYVHRAIEVEVRDAQSDAPIAQDATGEIVDGDYHAALEVAGWDDGQNPASAYLLGAYGPAGTYDVTVDHDGYQPWSMPGVQVQDDVCGVATVRLIAHLVPV